MQVPLDSLGSFPAGAAATVLVGLIVVAGKYFIDRRLESRRIDLETQRIRLEETRYSSEEERAQWRLRAEMRQEVYTAVGSTKACFFSAALALHDRLSNFFEDPDHTRPWLVLRSSPNEDAPYLRDFVLRLFNFYAWGRITQDALNSLPVELVSRENDDLLRLYTFINLANSLLTYTWLFRGVEDYPDASEDAHIFTSNLTRLTAMGVRIWKETEGGLPRESVDERYSAGEPPLLTLREMLAAMQAEDEELKHENQRAAFVIARLAALRAALAAYLTVDYSWAIALTEERTITSEFDRDLDYASALAPDHPDLPSLVRRNLGELMTRYRCGWLPVDEPSSQTEDNDKNNDQS